eukprot:TRINITY_DN3429_c0_g1_i1.p1 TRINITY_DN3429_c0_g1~~TRINITY_DN3429_c0_g1_i1.p1  ORF type:complete len:732 (+),score=112.67 TRINITY_DN3429_c0_g1_i1:98-2293(+)
MSTNFVPYARFSLIIGCSNYSQESQFKPLNDIKSDFEVARRFCLKHHFTTDVILNKPSSKVKHGLTRMTNLARASIAFDTPALFFIYYSGHGNSVNGKTFGYTIDGEAIELQKYLERLSSFSNVYVVAFLDIHSPSQVTLKIEKVQKTKERGYLVSVITTRRSNLASLILKNSNNFYSNSLMDEPDDQFQVFRDKYPKLLEKQQHIAPKKKKETTPKQPDPKAQKKNQQNEEKIDEKLSATQLFFDAIDDDHECGSNFPSKFSPAKWVTKEVKFSVQHHHYLNKDSQNCTDLDVEFCVNNLTSSNKSSTLKSKSLLLTAAQHLFQQHKYAESLAVFKSVSHPASNLILGYLYMYGLGAQRDKKLAERYLDSIDDMAFRYYDRLAKSTGNPFAYFALARMYHIGDGVRSQDYNLALIYYKTAADKGMTDAMWCLGSMYKHGVGTDKNFSKAVKYYIKAADRGNPCAQYKLGLIYLRGKSGFVKKDIPSACKYFKKAAQAGMVDAQYELGNIYLTNVDDGEIRYKTAAHYLKMAANQGNAISQCFMGVLHDNGLGVKKDTEKAVEYFKLATKKRLCAAQYHLGIKYYSGVGVNQNYFKAAHYFTLASEQTDEEGSANALYALGRMYEDGLGVERDVQKSVELIQAAANKGFAEAQYYVASAYQKGKGTTRNNIVAFNFMKLAADQGLKQAQLALAKMYATGCGVTKDKNQARYYQTLAASENHEDQRLPTISS